MLRGKNHEKRSLSALHGKAKHTASALMVCWFKHKSPNSGNASIASTKAPIYRVGKLRDLTLS
jgi:hypothetical protein